VELFFTRQAEKDFSGLPKSEKKKAVKKLETLKGDPLLGKRLTGKLKGFMSLRFWPYRVIYHIDKQKKEIWIDHIIHRQGAYK